MDISKILHSIQRILDESLDSAYKVSELLDQDLNFEGQKLVDRAVSVALDNGHVVHFERQLDEASKDLHSVAMSIDDLQDKTYVLPIDVDGVEDFKSKAYDEVAFIIDGVPTAVGTLLNQVTDVIVANETVSAVCGYFADLKGSVSLSQIENYVRNSLPTGHVSRARETLATLYTMQKERLESIDIIFWIGQAMDKLALNLNLPTPSWKNDYTYPNHIYGFNGLIRAGYTVSTLVVSALKTATGSILGLVRGIINTIARPAIEAFEALTTASINRDVGNLLVDWPIQVVSRNSSAYAYKNGSYYLGPVSMTITQDNDKHTLNAVARISLDFSGAKINEAIAMVAGNYASLSSEGALTLLPPDLAYYKFLTDTQSDDISLRNKLGSTDFQLRKEITIALMLSCLLNRKHGSSAIINRLQDYDSSYVFGPIIDNIYRVFHNAIQQLESQKPAEDVRVLEFVEPLSWDSIYAIFDYHNKNDDQFNLTIVNGVTTVNDVTGALFGTTFPQYNCANAALGSVVLFGGNEELNNAYTDNFIASSVYDLYGTLPSEFFVVMAKATKLSIMAFAATVGAIVMAVAVTGFILTKSLIKFKAAKSLKKVSKLQKAQRDYNNNPTPANKKALINQTAAYNLKASMLGTGTYDLANGWYNSSEAVSSSNTGNSAVLEKLSDAVYKLSVKITPDLA